MLKHIKDTTDWNEKSVGAKGFTLIELLVVIVILGILAAVVVFAVGGITDKGQKAACQSEANTIRTAVESYAAQNNNTYPTGYTSDNPPLVPGFLSKTPDGSLVTYSGGAPSGLGWGPKCINITGIGTP